MAFFSIYDDGFFSRNFVELERLRDVHYLKNNELVLLLEKALYKNFSEDDGWNITTYKNYIELNRDVWQNYYSLKQKRNICFEVGFFDCGGGMNCICVDDLPVSVSAIIMSSNLKSDLTCNFSSHPEQSVEKIISSLKEYEEKFVTH